MADDEPQPPRPAEPLDYYRPVGPSPARWGLFALAVLAGFVVGGVAVTAAGVACGLEAFAGNYPSHGKDRVSLWAAVGFGAAVLACVGGVVWHVRRGRRLEPDRRSRGGRGFLLGLLIGGGVAALAQGICFGSSARG